MLEVEQVTLFAPEQYSTPPEPFSHRFEPGAITVVLGANQAGKTNLCRLIAGLACAARGRVCWRGDELKDLTDTKPQHRPVSMVYQDFINYPNLTVSENIASPMRAAGVPRGARQEQVQQLAAMLGLEALLARFPAELSGGQQQRVAIARALAKRAKVLLLDEPLVNLDFKLRERLEVELRELLVEAGTTVIYTSSDPRDAFVMADKLLLLHEGRALQSGDPLELYARPVNAQAMAALCDPQLNTGEIDGQAFGVRPEHLHIDAAPASLEGPTAAFDMEVLAAETNGVDSYVHGVVAQREWVLKARGIVAVEAGNKVTVTARRADLVQF